MKPLNNRKKPKGPTNKTVDFESINNQKRRKGKKAEDLVLSLEIKILELNGFQELADMANDSPSTFPSYGYDIDSFELDGTPKQIEVKSIQKYGNTFYITKNELEKSSSLPNYYIYLVFDVLDQPSIKYIKHPKLGDNSIFQLIPENYKVRFNCK